MRVLVGGLPPAGRAALHIPRGASSFFSLTPTTRATSVTQSPTRLLNLPSPLVRTFATTRARSCLNMASEDPKDVRKYLQQSHDRIFENNKKWAEEQKKKHPEFFDKLSAGQAPEYLWIGMSASKPSFSPSLQFRSIHAEESK